MKPKFTDAHKFPRPYRRSIETDITRTWEAARKRMEAEKTKREEIVRQLPRKAHG